MPKPSPVSSPPLVRFREFCQSRLPLVVFIFVGAGVFGLWGKTTTGTHMIGRAEALHSKITAARAGTIASLHVDLFQRVGQGEVLAQITPLDLDAVSARLASNIELLRAQLLQTTDRNSLNYQQLRLEWMRNDVELSAAQIELQLAEANLERAGALFGSRIISEAEVQARQTRRDTLKDRVRSLGKITVDLQAEIKKLEPQAGGGESASDKAIAAALASQAAELKMIADSCVLKAPMDGIVSSINKRQGENIAVSEVALTVGALSPRHILAYAQHPLNSVLKAGDPVEIFRRNPGVPAEKSRITSLGTLLEPMDPSLIPFVPRSQQTAEYGLPFLVEIPPGMVLTPAEVVNIRWRKH